MTQQHAIVVTYELGNIEAWGPYADREQAAPLLDRFDALVDETVQRVQFVTLYADSEGHARADEIEAGEMSEPAQP